MISRTATTAAMISPIAVPEVPELLVAAVVVVAATVVVVVETVVEVEVEVVVVAGRVVVVVGRLVVVGATVVEVGATVVVGAAVDGGTVTCSGGWAPAAVATLLGRTTHAITMRMIPTLARIAGEATLQLVVAEEA